MTSQDTIENLTLFVNRGITPKYTESSQSSITVLNQKCIRDFQVSLEPARLHDCSKRKVTEGKELQKYDILINSTGVGTLGRVAQFFGETGSATVDSHITIVRPNIEKIDPVFLGYAVKAVQEIIEGFAAGSTGQTELSRDAVKALKLEFIEDRVSQEKVANFLLAIDDKIELNRQTNQTLEAIAQALFKSWFVDFDPVKAKMAVLESGGSAEEAELAAMGVISSKSADELAEMKAKSPADFEQLAETAGLFPSALVESELGLIPEGWGCKKLGDITTEIRRGISPKYTEDGGICVVNQKCIRNHTIDFSLAKRNDQTHRKVEGREARVGDVLVNSTGVGTLGRLAPVRYLPEQFVYDSHVTIVRANEETVSKSWLISFLFENEAFIEASGFGSTGQTELRKEVLELLPVCLPSKNISREFNSLIWPIHEEIASHEVESISLSAIRDALLPKLLSGEFEWKGHND